jgi:SAM-dependent methyltransferase
MAVSQDRTPEKFDAYARDYQALHAQSIAASGESTDYFAQYKLACLQRRGVHAEEPILDFGCGIGNVTHKLAEYFSDVHGYEPSLESLKVFHERVPKAAAYADAASIPDNHFAAAVLSGVLHHVSPDERLGVLRQVEQKLRPGGRVFIFEHNPLNPLTRRAVATCPFDDDAILLWPRELRKLLGAASFESVGLDYIVFFPKMLAFLRPLEPSLSWLAFGAQTLACGAKALR